MIETLWQDLGQLLVVPFTEFAFMRRALVGAVVLGISAAPLGVFLMLRRMSLTGDAMAHAILPGAALGYLVAGLSLPAMTMGGIVAGMVVALLSGLVARTTILREDASLAAFYLISLSLGVLLVSLGGSSVDLLHLLFGGVLALNDETLLLIAGVATCTLLVFAFIFRGLVAECVDPGFLRTVQGHGGGIHMVFLVLVVANLVAGFQALGTLLVVGIMMLPAVASRLWSRNLAGLITLAVAIACFATYAGLLASFHLSLPAGPAIVFSAGVVYIFSLLFGRVGGVVGSLLPSRHLEG